MADSGCALSKSRQSGEKGAGPPMMCPHLGKAGLHRHLRGLVLQQALNLVHTVERGVTSLGQAPYHRGANILLGDTEHKPEGYRGQLVLRTHAG